VLTGIREKFLDQTVPISKQLFLALMHTFTKSQAHSPMKSFYPVLLTFRHMHTQMQTSLFCGGK